MTDAELQRLVEAIHAGARAIATELAPWPPLNAIVMPLPDGRIVATDNYEVTDLVLDSTGANTRIASPEPAGLVERSDGWRCWRKSEWSGDPAWIITRIECNVDVNLYLRRGRAPQTFGGRDLAFGRAVRPVLAVSHDLDWRVATRAPARVVIGGLLRRG